MKPETEETIVGWTSLGILLSSMGLIWIWIPHSILRMLWEIYVAVFTIGFLMIVFSGIGILLYLKLKSDVPKSEKIGLNTTTTTI